MTRKQPAAYQAAAKAQDLSGLHPEALAWRARILAGWQVDDSAMPILDAATVALSRSMEARELLRRDGLMLPDNRPHAAIRIEQESTALFHRLLTSLHLE